MGSAEKVDKSKARSKSLQNPEKMNRFLLLQMTFLYLCSFTDGSEDVEFSLEVIKEKADYENLCFTCSVILVGVNGNLQKFTTYSTGYLESVIKLTKKLLWPKDTISRRSWNHEDPLWRDSHGGSRLQCVWCRSLYPCERNWSRLLSQGQPSG